MGIISWGGSVDIFTRNNIPLTIFYDDFFLLILSMLVLFYHSIIELINKLVDKKKEKGIKKPLVRWLDHLLAWDRSRSIQNTLTS